MRRQKPNKSTIRSSQSGARTDISFPRGPMRSSSQSFVPRSGDTPGLTTFDLVENRRAHSSVSRSCSENSKDSTVSPQVASFGPNSLRAIREGWIVEGLARTTVNDYIGVINQVFKWGVSHETVPPSVYHGLATLDGLRAGRSEARETEAVKPVLETHVRAVKPFVSRQVKALINLQLRTAARPGELLKLRSCSLVTPGLM